MPEFQDRVTMKIKEKNVFGRASLNNSNNIVLNEDLNSVKYMRSKCDSTIRLRNLNNTNDEKIKDRFNYAKRDFNYQEMIAKYLKKNPLVIKLN